MVRKTLSLGPHVPSGGGKGHRRPDSGRARGSVGAGAGEPAGRPLGAAPAKQGSVPQHRSQQPTVRATQCPSTEGRTHTAEHVRHERKDTDTCHNTGGLGGHCADEISQSRGHTPYGGIHRRSLGSQIHRDRTELAGRGAGVGGSYLMGTECHLGRWVISAGGGVTAAHSASVPNAPVLGFITKGVRCCVYLTTIRNK